MPSSWSVSLRFELQFTGENVNLWGEKLNTALQRVDTAIAGWTTVALTGNYSLTTANAAADEARSAMLKFTGTGPYTVTIPSVSKQYVMWNACNGSVVITTGAGATITLESGDKGLVFTDGSEVYQPAINGTALKAYIDAAILATTGSLPATTGNNGKALLCVSGAWTPTTLTVAYVSDYATQTNKRALRYALIF
jgi:hypothetical protein